MAEKPKFELIRPYLFKGLTAILCILGLSWLALDYFVPAPPSTILFAVGFKGGSYEGFAERYREVLARSHVKLETRTTNRVVENLKLLEDANSGVQAAFVQSGIKADKQGAALLSLGRINYQAFCLFYRANQTLDDLTQLKGKRIAAGPVGSGTRAVTEKILGISGVTSDTATLLPLAGQNANKALKDGDVDVVIHASDLDAPYIQALLRDPEVRLMSLPRAEALTRIFPFLVRLELPRGVIDYEKNIPANDVTMIATTNVVLVRGDTHPEIIGLLAQTLLETHGGSGLLHRAGDFPTQSDNEYPMATGARDFYKNGPSFLNRYLPFWITNSVQRAIAVLVTAVAIVLPLFNYLPRLYRWFVRERTKYLYRRLRHIEKNLQTELTAPQIAALQGQLEKIDQAATILWIPMGHSDLFFSLKVHINLVRTRLGARFAEAQRLTAKVA